MRPHGFETSGIPGRRHWDAPLGLQYGLYKISSMAIGIAAAAPRSLPSTEMPASKMFWTSLTSETASLGRKSPWARQIAPVQEPRNDAPSEATFVDEVVRRALTSRRFRFEDKVVARFTSAIANWTADGLRELPVPPNSLV
jgi:hypothetical protein